MKGKFIVFEGIDGAGQSTQSFMLANYLKSRGIDVQVTENPSKSITGYIVRIACKTQKKITPHADALLFAADRVQHTKDTIRPALDSGSFIITQRYLLSSLAYQTSFGVDEDWIRTINSDVVKPDITIFLDINPKKALERRFRGVYYQPMLIEKFEKEEVLIKVRKKYLELIKKEPNAVVLDASKTPEEVHEDVKKNIERLLK